MNASLFLIVATAVTFFLVGAVLVATFAVTALSHNQHRMQKQLRRWQEEVVRLRRSDDHRL